MFSSISSLLIGSITITNEDSSHKTNIEFSKKIPKQLYSNIRHEFHGETLLSVLDDKNKLISCLKKQLQNQKMQLTYYLQRDLSANKIKQFSESCTPQASEESLPLNLALNKFRRQSGIKTKLLLLHERMNRLDSKISNSLKEQEYILRKIVNKLCDFVKVKEFSGSNLKDRFGNYIRDPCHIDLFNKLLSATLNLRRKLDGFKICCQQVLIVEEERNAIVEHVYSLPVEERVNRNYLLRVQMEKVQLENEIKRISQCNAASKHRVKELNVIENILQNLQLELNSSFLLNEENCISRMLKKINSEARVLLQTTKEQKRKFECELSQTKCPAPDRVLFFINLASGRDKFEQNDFDRYGIKPEEIRFFELIKRDIDLLKKNMEEKAETQLRVKITECNVLKRKVSEMFLDTTKAKLTNTSLQTEIEELKSQQSDEIQRLKQERDAYSTQVEDLQAIREAYAQLVDKQPNTFQMEREFIQELDEREHRIKDLEKMLNEHKEEKDGLKAKVQDQRDQIIVLNRFIYLTRPNSPTFGRNSQELVIFNAEPCSGPLNEINNNRTDIWATEKSKSKKSFQLFPRNRRYFMGTKKYSKESFKNASSSKRKIPQNTPKYFTDIQRVMSNSLETLSESGQKSLRSIFHHKNGDTRDIIKAGAKTRDEMKGNVTMEKSSVFSVEIKYKNSKMDDAVFELDEYEVFKDVSRESVVLANRYNTTITRPFKFNSI